MNKEQLLLSQITIFQKYAKYIPSLNRRETWEEIVARYLTMMVEKYPQLSHEIYENGQLILDKKVLPSMRALQFAGPAIDRNPARIYNCCFLPIDDYRSFGETMFLLLGGTGVGYSVQNHHVEKLPEIKIPTKERRFLIGDSIEGWADAVKALVKCYLIGGSKPRFDFSDIRHKGVRLITAGGKAPGPEPLKLCLAHIESILASKKAGEKLRPIEAHDIQCHIANAVLAGGIRRAAMISLFSFDDEEMLTSKFGNWWELNEQRGRSNNSAVIIRTRIRSDEFMNLWNKIEASNAGEPGIYFSNNADWGTNPCAEIALRPYQFCNLCEINVSDVISEEDLKARIHSGTFFGTLQAGFTDFHYLREIWKRTTEKDALIGVGMTGIASGSIANFELEKYGKYVIDVNKKYSKIIGINSAARCTTVKPSGTTSCVLGTSSGIHAWHSEFYIRRMRINKSEDLYRFLVKAAPSVIKDEYFNPTKTAVIEIPQCAPHKAVTRTEPVFDMLERTINFNQEWVKAGHVKGDNTNNVSATVSINKDNYYKNPFGELITPIRCHSSDTSTTVHDEWKAVGKWLWEHRNEFNGMSVLPMDNGSYIQAPFEDITKAKYDELIKDLGTIDLSQVIEIDDETAFSQEVACAGGACEI